MRGDRPRFYWRKALTVDYCIIYCCSEKLEHQGWKSGLGLRPGVLVMERGNVALKEFISCAIR